MRNHAVTVVTLLLCVTALAVCGGTAVAIETSTSTASVPLNTTAQNTTTANTTDNTSPKLTREIPPPAGAEQSATIGVDLRSALAAGDSTGRISTRGQATNTAADKLVVTITPATQPEQATPVVREYGAVFQVVNGKIEASIRRDRIRSLAEHSEVQRVQLPTVTEQTGMLVGTKTIGGEYLRSVNKTGESVRVAVIDHAFDPTHEPIAGNVVETVSYTNDGFSDDGGTGHGDASAEILTDVAPNVELILYSAKTYDQNVAAAKAISTRDDIDVVSLSLGLASGGTPLDGSDEWSQAISKSVNSGTVWAVSAGNGGEGTTHYSAPYNTNQFSNRHTFGAKDTPADLTEVAAESGRIQGSLQWNEWPTRTTDLVVALYTDANSNGTYTAATDADGDHHLARASYWGGPITEFSFVENITDSGKYAVAIFNGGTTEEPESTVRMNAFLDYGAFTEHPTRNYTITPPATDEEVLTVGAASANTPRTNKQLRPYSSRGPTVDGRTGIDLIGPDGVQAGPFGLFGGFRGTSAAAPHVAGVAALVHSDLEVDSNPQPNVTNIGLRITGQTLSMGGSPTEVGGGHLEARRATLPQNVLRASAPTLVTSQNDSAVSVSTRLRVPPPTDAIVGFAAYNRKTDEIVETTVPASTEKTSYTAMLNFTGYSAGAYQLTAYVRGAAGQESPRTPTLATITTNTRLPNADVETGARGSINNSTAKDVPVQLRFDKPMNTSQTPTVQLEGLTQEYPVSATVGWINATTYAGEYSIPSGVVGTAVVNVTAATDAVGNPIGQTNSSRIEVDTATPRVVALDVEGGLRTVNLTLTANEELASAILRIEGPDGGTRRLTEKTANSTQSGNYRYQTTYNVSIGGSYTVELVKLTDTAGNAGTSNQVSEIAVADEDAGTLTGEITSQATGATLSDVTVELLPKGEPPAGATPQTANVYENGTYSIRTATGAYTVTVIHNDGLYTTTTISTGIDLATATTTNVTLPPKPAALTGRIEPGDAANVSFAGTSVTITDQRGTTVATRPLNTANVFTIRSIEPGTYTVTTTPRNYSVPSTNVTLAPNESRTITQQAEPLDAQAEGLVTDNTTGTAPVTAAVKAVDATTGRVTAAASVNRFGEYVLELEPGEYRLHAGGPMYKPSQRTVSVSANGTVTADFTLNRVTEFGLVESVSAPANATVDDNITIQATVRSVGTAATNATIVFSVDNTTVETGKITNLAPEQSDTVGATYTVPRAAANSTVSILAETADSAATNQINVAPVSKFRSNGGGSPSPAPQPSDPGADKTNETSSTEGLPVDAVTVSAASGKVSFENVTSLDSITFKHGVNPTVTVIPELPNTETVPLGGDVVTGVTIQTDKAPEAFSRQITFVIAAADVETPTLVVARETDAGWSAVETTVTASEDEFIVTAATETLSRVVVVETSRDSPLAAMVTPGATEPPPENEHNATNKGKNNTGITRGPDDGNTTDTAPHNRSENPGSREPNSDMPVFGVMVSIITLLAVGAAVNHRT